MLDLFSCKWLILFSDSLSREEVSERLSLACFSSISFSSKELCVATRAASAASRLDLRSEVVEVFLLTSHRLPHFLNLQLSLDQRVKGFRKTQVLESDIRGLAEPAGDVPQLLLHTGQVHLMGQG